MSYFKIGEQCILQSESCPELNGECVITQVLEPEPRIIHLSNLETKITNAHCYFTTIENIERLAWAESALRKKHKPSTQSLSTIIEELNKAKV
jgi:hypothetical protein